MENGGTEGAPRGDGPSLTKIDILREGPCSQGASCVVCGSGVPPYDFLYLYGIFDSMFCASFS
jgi:hypothetical protein